MVLRIGVLNPREGNCRFTQDPTSCKPESGKPERPSEGSFQQEGFCSYLLFIYTQKRHICDEFHKVDTHLCHHYPAQEMT